MPPPLNARLRAGVAGLPGITIHSPQNAVPEVLNFSTNCVNSQTFISYLSDRQIYVSGGSACDKGEPSHTLLAMGCDGGKPWPPPCGSASAPITTRPTWTPCWTPCAPAWPSCSTSEAAAGKIIGKALDLKKQIT